MKEGQDLIGPETRVAALLERFPELEEVLLQLSPAFAKLRNPLLRKTVARIATLRQAAVIAKLPMEKLIGPLRQATGQPTWNGEDDTAAPSEQLPDWFDAQRISRTLDARPLLEAGQNPLAVILQEVEQLAVGEILELASPFAPAPLIDLLRKRGFRHCSRQPQADLVLTYFTADPAAGPAAG